MGDEDAFERILVSLCDAVLDDARWPATSALIDEACGMVGNALLVGEGPKDDVRVLFVGIYLRGQRRVDVEREYLKDYHSIDERVARVRQLPDSRLVHMTDLYTPGELKTSPTFNEILRRAEYQNGLTARLDGLDGSYMSWIPGNPVTSEGWGAAQVAMVTRLLPQIRQFILVRQALVRAEAQSTTVTALLDNPRIGVVQLDRRGRVLAVNDRAGGILRHADGLSDRDGVLRARTPAGQRRLERLVADALPTSAAVAVGGSMLLRRSPLLPPFVVHVKPVPVPQPDYGARHVAALVLIVEPGRHSPVDPDTVASTLGLTRAESQVAAWLAEGKSVRDMAEATGHTEATIYWHLKRIYRKHSISRQVDLARLVLSLAEFA